jgi:hypothetical protein
MSLQLVIAHLDDNARLNRGPCRVLLRRPPAGRPGDASLRIEAVLRYQVQKALIDLNTLPIGETGAMPDEMELTLIVVNPQEK